MTTRYDAIVIGYGPVVAPRLRQGTLEAAAGFWTISSSSTSNVMVALVPPSRTVDITRKLGTD